MLSRCSGVKATPATPTHPLCPPTQPQRIKGPLYESLQPEYQLVLCSFTLAGEGREVGQTLLPTPENAESKCVHV